MVVDDDPEVLESFQEITGKMGISCDTVLGGEKAAELLDQNKFHDIYFIDWKMPGINGIQLTKKIKKQCPGRTMVTMITSAEWGIIADEARAAGVDNFLPKPIFPADITDCINSCFGPDSAAETLAGDTRPAARNTFANHRILLAEDVEINREIVLALLEPMALKIDCAENGLETLRIFSENPECYDMILMDVQMPEMDGLEATRRIRAFELERSSNSKVPEFPAIPGGIASETPGKPIHRIPIIAMTANVFREDIEKCHSTGMDDHLGKPLDIDMVLEKLRKYLL